MMKLYGGLSAAQICVGFRWIAVCLTLYDASLRIPLAKELLELFVRTRLVPGLYSWGCGGTGVVRQ